MSLPAFLLEPAPSSMADRAYQDVRDRLILLDIPPNEPLDDEELARSLTMGRTPVREALKRLEGDRLVVTYPRRGTFATGIDLVDLGHLCEILGALAPLAARRAAERAPSPATDELAGLLDETSFWQPGADRDTVVQRDLALHRALYRAAGNPHLENTLTRYGNLAGRIQCAFFEQLRPRRADVVAGQQQLLRAVVDGEAASAETLTRQQLRDFEAAVSSVI